MFDCVSWVVAQLIFSLKCQKHSFSIWLSCVHFRAARTLNCKEKRIFVWLDFLCNYYLWLAFSQMTCNFPAQIIFPKNYNLRFCRERCPFTEMWIWISWKETSDFHINLLSSYKLLFFGLGISQNDWLWCIIEMIFYPFYYHEQYITD